MSDSTRADAATRRGLRGPAFRPFAPSLDPIDPGAAEGDVTDDEPTETMEGPTDQTDDAG